MSDARRVTIEFLGDDKSASSTARSLDNTTSKLGTTFSKVGKLAAVGLAVGIGAAAAAMTSCVKAAVEDQASASKLATALQDTTGATDAQIASVESYILKMSLASGVADDELRPAFQKLVTATGDVGKAQSLMGLAMDASAGTGKSLEAVTAALAKAQNGSTGGLAKLGIATKDAAGNALSFTQIQKKMAESFGGQAAAKADTFQGKMERLKVVFNEAKETIGYALIPILTQLADVFVAKVVPVIQQTAQWIAANLVPSLKAMGLWVKNNAVGVGVFVGAIAAAIVAFKVYAAVSKVIAIVQAVQAVSAGVATEAQMGLNAAMKANMIGLVVIALAALAAGLVIAYKKSATFREVVHKAFTAVKVVVHDAMTVIKTVITTAVAVVKAVWSRFGDNILSTIKVVWKTVQGVIKGYLDVIRGIIKTVTAIIHGNWADAWHGILDILRGVWQIIKSVITGYLGIIKEAFRLAWGVVKDIVRLAWQGLMDLVRTGASNLVDVVKGIPDRLLSAAGSFLHAGSSLIKSIFSGISSAAGAAGGFISGLAGQLMTAARNAINSALDLPLTISFHKGPIDIDATVIPAFAKGGIVTSPTLALLGEAGPEAVIPLGRGRRGAGGGGDINLTVNLVAPDGKLIQQQLLKLKRTNGLELGLA